MISAEKLGSTPRTALIIPFWSDDLDIPIPLYEINEMSMRINLNSAISVKMVKKGRWVHDDALAMRMAFWFWWVMLFGVFLCICEEPSESAAVAGERNSLNHNYLRTEIKKLTSPEDPLDHYQLLQKLGAGAFGQVLLAQSKKSSKKVSTSDNHCPSFRT